MLETIAIVSNGLVIVAIGVLWRKVDSQEKAQNKHVVDSTRALNNHIINFTEAIGQRPDFDQVDKRIEKVSEPFCKKIKSLTNDFRHHVHEGNLAKVVL